jgi:NAD+ synthase
MQTDLEVDPLRIDAALVTEILVRFIRAEIYRTGFRRGVVGLSGGIDSTVVTYLAASALGPDNVLAVTMPYKTSSAATRRDSAAVIERLGVRSVDLPITDQVDAYFAMLPDATQLRRANKSARERMTILYDQSAAFQALVLGTSNKSELLLGYGTQFGDMASAINPIGDLYKRQLYPLAEYLEVPESIRTKEPTGDLWVGQTDAGELGFSYQQVDRLLYQMIDRRMDRAALLAAGFEADFTDRVGEMVRRNHYKRRLPIIAKLSHRTMDRDFRYARDWGT